MNRAAKAATVAWLITAVSYFYQCTLRSAPAVMMPQLSAAIGLTATGVASMVELFYYGYSPFSLVAGVAMDRIGPRRVIPIGAALVGVGALPFATGSYRRVALYGLTIRVSGYAVNFVRLTREQQMDVINRTFHGEGRHV